MSPERNDGLHAQPPVSAADFSASSASSAANSTNSATASVSITPPMPESHGGGGGGAAPRSSLDERPQIWIIGTRDQVIHLMNEFYVKKIANDRVKFTPIVPAPFAKDKFMTVLVR
ncbi:hypothetical protein HNI00_03560 [Thermoleptolyngbya oregonensis NK1-22]|uniref:Uncharacterized protein n=1 Tax=Thermoleptolyngbya oregonensis NK1-22 TaxID=2547457 RepID=A0AA97BBY0_9CYAN|nr:hypothetical protein [Thermoleptolyngbya oregonensis]WOB42339.1 hypothetical protein HNI00_03560 [Thermoleptolyngbya oregonensis NK1-22]